LLVSGRYYLDAVNFGNHQDLQDEDFEQQLAGNHQDLQDEDFEQQLAGNQGK
jgi:hypothetical protein